MARGKGAGPTEKELAILKTLWANGPSTVRQVHEALSGQQATGYTTTLKLMQIMTEKGLLVRDDSAFKHVFKPVISEESTEKQIVRDVVDKVFAGSAEKLVMRALSAKDMTAEERTKIRELLDEMED